MDENRYTTVCLITAMTPLLAGASQGGNGSDSAIQRRAADGFPKVDGSTWKGAVMDALKGKKEYPNSQLQRKGPAKVSFSDLKILLLPVMTESGYCLLTCPNVWKRFMRELRWMKNIDFNEEDFKPHVELNEALCFGDNVEKQEWIGGCIFNLKKENPSFLYKKGCFDRDIEERIRMVSNENFAAFAERETEKNYRIKVDQIKHKADGKKLFREEYLPEGSVLYGFITEFRDLFEDELKLFDYAGKLAGEFRMGKNSSYGKGIVCLREMMKYGR